MSNASRNARRRRILLTCVIAGVCSAVASVGTYAAFSSTTSNSGNSFASGTVSLSDNDSGAAMLSLSNAKPNDSSTGCITVQYGGSLSANVHMYGSTTGSLPTYLDLTITQGTGTVSFGSACSGFSAGTQIYSGTLANFSSTYTSYSSGISLTNENGSVTWTNGPPNDYNVYKFVISLENNNSAQGLSGTASFTWEAENT
jgi:predicted ribosomally synthesized peptide with SipW-like signal peptide